MNEKHRGTSSHANRLSYRPERDGEAHDNDRHRCHPHCMVLGTSAPLIQKGSAKV